MNTFLPYPSFEQSAKCLDTKRLGKQRVETFQLVRTLQGYTQGWVNHPAAVMWRGFDHALIQYGLVMCLEWTERGYKDTTFNQLLNLSKLSYTDLFQLNLLKPKWIGSEPFHASHRSNLLRKDPIHYGRFGWTEDSWLDYVWPGEA